MNNNHSTIPPVLHEDPAFMVPASMMQRQFWLIHQMQKEASAYNIVSAFILRGPLHISAIEESLLEIVQRHQIFRTNFILSKGALLQKVHGKRNIEFTVRDISSLETPHQEDELKKLIDHETVRPFDLEESSLLRVMVVRLEEEKHALIIVMHHIITDLQAKRLLGAELSARYNTKTRRQTYASPDTTQQYADYTKRQLEWLKSPSAATMVSFWKRELQEQNGVLNLPVDYARPAGLTYNGSYRAFILTRQQTAEIEEFSRKNTVDIFVTLLTSFLVLLFRYTSQPLITIGVPLTNRRHEDDKNTMGCFVNILPLSFDLTQTTSFSEALKLVRMKMLTAHRNQEAPFEVILDAIKPKRDPSYNPLFQVGFTAEPNMEVEFNHIAAEPLQVHNKGAQLDLFLNMKSLGPEIEGYFEFNTDLFAPETIQRMCDHYLNILRAAVTEPDQDINLLPLLSDADKMQILVQFNDTVADIPDCCLHQLFERQAAKTPDAVAALFGDTALSYGELNARANQLAHCLRSQGVGRGNLVGVHLERSLDMLVAIHGIHKAGGAYVPLDTEFPPHRISQMLDDAQPDVILTQEMFIDSLPTNSSQLLCMDRDWQQIAAWPLDNPTNIAVPDDLAYVIFTSGSTGRPKGVQVPQRAVVNFLASMQHEPGITDSDTLLAVTTLSFDISVLELLLPLTVGAKVVIADSRTARDGQALLDLIRSSGTTIIQATPTTFRLLIGAGWNSRLPVRILCGGEPFPAELARELTALADSVWNMYGPTETTIWSTCHKITEGKPVLIGRPIANTRVYIVNGNNQPTPIGVPGEMLIGGLGVTRGYLNRAELTRKQFIPDMFVPGPENTLYRTGDLACYLPGGDIKIHGRIDQQIKIRGFRIELGEIETAIESHPAVRQGVVKPHAFASGDTRLAAYVTLHSGTEHVQLRTYLKDILPDYMIPSAFTVLPEMPLTPNNKIDRKALPDPDRTRPELDREMALPQNEIETHLAQKWRELLQLDQVGIDDTFFDLGGNSLLSIQLIAQLEQEMQIAVPVVKFYQYPTIRSFSLYLRQNQERKVSVDLSAERVHRQRQAMQQFRQRRDNLK